MVAAAASAIALAFTWQASVTVGAARPSVVGLLAATTASIPVACTAFDGGLRVLLAKHRRMPADWRTRAAVLFLCATVIGLVAAGAAAVCGRHVWSGFVVEYVLLVTTLAGYYVALSIPRPGGRS